ncbi:MAG: hypothetical protein JNJ83_16540 [Verrucomicrobiaceae bacterium]|nr:hypothetical protein [Verrucomicrobiaceae bacterium]
MSFQSGSPMRSVAQLVCVIGIAVLVPALICRSDSLEKSLRVRDVKQKRVMRASGGVEDAPTGRAILQAAKPEWVLIGNSMLNSRIEPNYLTGISGQRLYKLSVSGTKSPMWYLLLKLVVVESGVKPKCVTIFYRDRDLTWPELRMHRNEEMVDRMKGREQPEWPIVMGAYDRAQAMSWPGMMKRVSGTMDGLFAAEKMREWARWKMKKVAFKFTALGPEMTDEDRRDELNDALSMDYQRSDWASTLQGEDAEVEAQGPDPGTRDGEEPIVFDPSPQESFLPYMVDLAKRNGFILHFHKVKRRPDPPTGSEAELTLPAYTEALKAWLKENGCLFTDEGGETSITEEMYHDGDHIKTDPQYQRPYMEIFWRNVQPTIEGVLGPKARAK